LAFDSGRLALCTLHRHGACHLLTAASMPVGARRAIHVRHTENARRKNVVQRLRGLLKRRCRSGSDGMVATAPWEASEGGWTEGQFLSCPQARLLRSEPGPSFAVVPYGLPDPVHPGRPVVAFGWLVPPTCTWKSIRPTCVPALWEGAMATTRYGVSRYIVHTQGRGAASTEHACGVRTSCRVPRWVVHVVRE